MGQLQHVLQHGNGIRTDAVLFAEQIERARDFTLHDRGEQLEHPITVGEAAAALRSLEIVDSDVGRDLLLRLRSLTKRFEDGLARIGIETIPGEHPVVPLMIRDTQKTRDLVH